jgi:glucose dehydrogenase
VLYTTAGTRGVSYWTDGKGDARVVFVTAGYRLIALDAHTGQPINRTGRTNIGNPTSPQYGLNPQYRPSG